MESPKEPSSPSTRASILGTVYDVTGDLYETISGAKAQKREAATNLQSAFRAKKARVEVEKIRAHENSIFTKTGRVLYTGLIETPVYVVTAPVYAVGEFFSSPSKAAVESPKA